MDEVIGTHVRYFDYLGLERFGIVIAAERYRDDLAYLYIEDEEPEYNVHEDFVNGAIVRYAEIRLSDQVNIDERN